MPTWRWTWRVLLARHITVHPRAHIRKRARAGQDVAALVPFAPTPLSACLRRWEAAGCRVPARPIFDVFDFTVPGKKPEPDFQMFKVVETKRAADSARERRTRASPERAAAPQSKRQRKRVRDAERASDGASDGEREAVTDPNYDGPRRRPLVERNRGEEPKACAECGRTSTPHWRRGPLGVRTLCNACGTRWSKKRARR